MSVTLNEISSFLRREMLLDKDRIIDRSSVPEGFPHIRNILGSGAIATFGDLQNLPNEMTGADGTVYLSKLVSAECNRPRQELDLEIASFEDFVAGQIARFLINISGDGLPTIQSA